MQYETGGAYHRTSRPLPLMPVTVNKDRQNMWDAARALYHMLCKVRGICACRCDSHAGTRETNEPTTSNTHKHTHTHTWREEIQRTVEAKH